MNGIVIDQLIHTSASPDIVLTFEIVEKVPLSFMSKNKNYDNV